jgi:hypothetical protein
MALSASVLAATLSTTPCKVRDVDARCATFDVPEDRAHPAQRTREQLFIL